MSQEKKAGRRIVRKRDIGTKIGVGKTATDQLIAQGLIRVFALTPGGRAKGAFEDELDEYLERQAAQAVRK